VRRQTLGSPGVRAWKEGETCIWRRAGVWDVRQGKPVLLKPAHFAMGDFNGTCLRPFILRFTREIRAEAALARSAASNSSAASNFSAASTSSAGPDDFSIFIEGPAHGESMPSFKKDEIPGIVNAAHWYDAFTLTFKRWTGFLAFDTEKNKVVIGPKAVRSYFREAMERILEHSKIAMGGIPSILGEFGLPFDLNGRRAFADGNYRTQEKALAAYYEALDAGLMNATLWNYSASNSHASGDGWNGEDLSVFCLDEKNRAGASGRQTSINGQASPAGTAASLDTGGRALRGFVRPYAMATAGRPLRMSFDRITGKFRYSFEADFSIEAPTEIFIPSIHYPNGFDIDTRGCRQVQPAPAGTAVPVAGPTLLFAPNPGATRCEIVIRRRG
jgi:hypothetical protein